MRDIRTVPIICTGEGLADLWMASAVSAWRSALRLADEGETYEAGPRAAPLRAVFRHARRLRRDWPPLPPAEGCPVAGAEEPPACASPSSDSASSDRCGPAIGRLTDTG